MSNSTLAQQPHYRRTKSGEWVIQGPASVIKPGTVVTVHKKDGSVKTETISRVGKAFQQDGIAVVYGYIGASTRDARPRRSGRGECYECGEWGPSGHRCTECCEGHYC